MPRLNSPHNAPDDYRKPKDLGNLAHGVSITQGSFNADGNTDGFANNKVDKSVLRNQSNENSVVSRTKTSLQVDGSIDRLAKNELTTNYNS